MEIDTRLLKFHQLVQSVWLWRIKEYRILPSQIHHTGRYVGQLEIHGQKRLRMWTKVNATAFAGNNWLITSEPVDFKAEEIIILTR